ncbi:hypothetical protein ATPR_1733 [Acetobacter tropicalis NBRC 101654]|uniref:Uncharacterized protein n=1 Tax=Acetobacter tropicalis NBRC 101654 TaxID=749388 RepID=F7VED4_9PROT|nr:hypothetical protein ATPR_1733 [Acetobacter tropicalis NBRC 101654]
MTDRACGLVEEEGLSVSAANAFAKGSVAKPINADVAKNFCMLGSGSIERMF